MPTTRVIFSALASVVGFTALVTAQAKADVGFAPLVTTQVKADPREKLETAIPEAIRLLEAKEYETFLKTFVVPDDFQKITKKMWLNEFATQFGKDKAADLLQVLKSVKGKKPTLDSKEKKATFKHKVKGVPKDSISFVKVENFWYIQN